MGIFGFCGASTRVDEGAWISKKKKEKEREKKERVSCISVTRWQQHTFRATEICAFVLHSSTKSGQNQSNKLQYEEIRSAESCLTNKQKSLICYCYSSASLVLELKVTCQLLY
jgi:hypothetical protein